MTTKIGSFISIPADALTRGVSTYDAPGEDFDDVVSIELPPAPAVAAGLEPDQSWFGAQSLNAIWQNWGRALDATVDLASFQVTRLMADHGSDRLDYSDVDGTGLNGNSTGTQPPLLFVGSNGWLYAQMEHKFGHVGDAAFRRFGFWGSGLQIHGDDASAGIDENAWTDSEDWPGLSPAESGRAVVLGSDRNSAYVIALGDTRTVSVSADRGATWSGGAAALPANANWTKPLVAHAMGTQWIVVDYCPTTTNVNRVLVSNDLDVASWTTLTGTVCGGPDGGTVRRITANSTVAIFLPHQNTTIGRWEFGDTDVSDITLADPDTDIVLWRGAWNEQIQEFMIGNANGQLWGAGADGADWTLASEEESEGFGVADIVAHGRGFVVSNSQNSDLWFVHYNQMGELVKDRIASGFEGNDVSSTHFHLAAIDGRWVAARVNAYAITGGMGNLMYAIEVLHSARQSWDVEGVVGR
jgi:hypothetical protein